MKLPENVAIARQCLNCLKAYNQDGMQALSTPKSKVCFEDSFMTLDKFLEDSVQLCASFPVMDFVAKGLHQAGPNKDEIKICMALDPALPCPPPTSSV